VICHSCAVTVHDKRTFLRAVLIGGPAADIWGRDSAPASRCCMAAMPDASRESKSAGGTRKASDDGDVAVMEGNAARGRACPVTNGRPWTPPRGRRRCAFRNEPGRPAGALLLAISRTRESGASGDRNALLRARPSSMNLVVVASAWRVRRG
jgi:hypothetical protein